jgi:hypothetical protein
VQLDGVELGVLLVDWKDLSSARRRIDASHENVTLVGVRSELLNGRFSDRLVCASPIELANRLEGDRLEVLLLLRFAEWVLEDDLALEQSPIFTKRCRGELQNAAV